MIEPDPGSGGWKAVAISHYRIVQKLRSGGMGEVYLAEDEILPRVVALKLLPLESSSDDILQHRFMREARAASSLSHPNIARIYEAGEDGGRFFMAMEYVVGESLDERIARGAVSINEIVSIALQLGGAVEEAHKHGIIHRDLKPSNIMLTESGDVKVLDFGLAKVTDPEIAPAEATAWKTESGLVMGTVPYMSPEQALGKPVDPRSDLFSIGVVLYELVTLRLPFPGATVADTLFRIVNSQPEPMARFNYELPVELERIIRKCLEKSPDSRYQTVSDLLVDLRNFDRDRRVACDSHAAARIAASLNRSRTLLWAAMLFVAAIAGMVVWKRSAPASTPVPIRSIAVLPFDNDAGEEASDLSDGIADLVISDLAQLPGLRVIARSTSFLYRDTESPLLAGSALNVDAVLTGRVEAKGDLMIVSTELVEVRDGSRIGGARFERGRDQVAMLATAIGDDVARSLKLPSAHRSRSLASARDVNAETFQLYLRGRQQWNTRTPEGLRAALDMFRQTIEVDPEFAPAYAGLADTYSLLERYANVPNRESRDRALSAAEHAVRLDPSLPEAHASLASVRETYAWDWLGAEREYRAAIRLSPSYATAHHWLAMLLARLGRFNDARQEIAIARELDPLSPAIAASVANIDYYAGDYARSIEQARAALRLKSGFAHGRVQLALSLALSGDNAGALRELKPAQGVATAAIVEAMIRARAGEVEAARGFLAAAESRPDAASIGYGLAAVHVALGELPVALEWLRAAESVHSFWLGWVAVDPVFKPLQDDPEFVQLLHRVGVRGHAS